ncbi:MAG: hypothetical protein PHP30_08970 [Bacteroidales bacterium]|nr:hypothetical protein [Bacteroidales bacterium]MDD4638723.1 hypothetical protein [Bacteroidales bacterium]
MIDILAREHDDYSFEFKIGYRARSKVKLNTFRMNLWIFIPAALDINRRTYGRADFYKDIINNIRLITPVFLLRDIAKEGSTPFLHLENSFNKLASSFSRGSVADFEYQIKMFSAIFKSAIRDQLKYIFSLQNIKDRDMLFEELLDNIESVLTRYRSLAKVIQTPEVPQKYYNYYEFGDEFLSNLVDNHLFAILDQYCSDKTDFANRYRDIITSLIKREENYKKEKNYPLVSENIDNNNTDLVYRRGLLKKFIESDLFLDAKKKRDGVLTEQIYFSLAAGLSMVFATAIAFSFQQKFGNFTMPLFVALVVSYMLKDRIKELIRHYFAHQRGSKYFDTKTTVSIKENQIGWSKEGFDFVPEPKVPQEILKIRDRSALPQADNRFAKEKIILYRKLVHVDRSKLDANSKYFIEGINEIIRLSVHSFINKMDDPDAMLYKIGEKGDLRKIKTLRVYYLSFIIELKYEDFLQYKYYRLVFNRNGIIRIEERK